MRIRTTKRLGQRVNRSYLKRLFPIPLWRRILTAGVLAVALGWLGMYAVARNQTPYTAGPLTSSHAFLGKQCANCHGVQAGIDKKVADGECLSCHSGPIHNTEQVETPACRNCHVEHRGEAQMAGLSDRGCVACHANLKTKSGQLNVAAHIGSFAAHPEFAIVTHNSAAPGIKFNHAKHVGELSQKCGDCHMPTEASGVRAPHSRISPRPAMSIPTYAGTCMPCHLLSFDDKIADAAPHDKPEAVHNFMEGALAKYIAAHPGDLGKNGTPANAGAWVQFKVKADEQQLRDMVCATCHDTSNYPVIPAAKASGPAFTKAMFDHGAHQAVTCASCHPKAATSTNSQDLLLPGIETCRQCHNSSKTSAGDECATCHVYHDWTKAKPFEAKYTPGKIN